MIERMKRIYRTDLRNNPQKVFLFGDNLERVGMGGQAYEMRDEPNAIGVATKYSPGMRDEDFFTDDDYDNLCKIIDSDLARAFDAKIVVIPSDGLGTGLAELDNRAPKVFAYLQEQLVKLEANNVR